MHDDLEELLRALDSYPSAQQVAEALDRAIDVEAVEAALANGPSIDEVLRSLNEASDVDALLAALNAAKPRCESHYKEFLKALGLLAVGLREMQRLGETSPGALKRAVESGLRALEGSRETMKACGECWQRYLDYCASIDVAPRD